MARPAPFTMQPTRAIELDVVQAELRSFHFERIFFVQVAQFGQILVAEHRVVVEVDLGVERVNLAVLRQDERIDLGERRVHLDACFRQRDHRCRRAVHGGRRNADAERQLARLIRLQAETRIDRLLSG